MQLLRATAGGAMYKYAMHNSRAYIVHMMCLPLPSSQAARS
jgi:hypothetical protein